MKEKILDFLKRSLDPARYRHTLGTRIVCRELAAMHGIDPDKAELAALFHDAGKSMDKHAMVRYVRRHRISVPERADVIRLHPSLLHSYISEHIARTRFGVRDKAVLSAIRCHTLGSPSMGVLDKIMYVADAVSPDRRYRQARVIRSLAHHDLNAAVKQVMAGKLEWVITKREWLHPQAVDVWNSLTGNR